MTFDTRDTIVAIATPPGRGGIGVVRVSGPEAHPIARALITHPADLLPRHATLTDPSGFDQAVAEASGDVRDHAIVTYFPAPASYTGDDVVEVSAHGSPVILRAIVAAAIERGARAAEPGEFTLRAFLNGRIDLMQAEAVADLIDAATPLQASAAFDQLEGTLTRAIAGIDAGLFDLSHASKRPSIFQTRDITSSNPARWRGRSTTSSRRPRAARRRSSRAPRSRRITGRHRRQPERREIESLQCAAWRRPRHRDGSSRDDARPRHGNAGSRRPSIDARRHRGVARSDRSGGDRRRRRSRQAVAVADAIVHVIDDDHFPSQSAPTVDREEQDRRIAGVGQRRRRRRDCGVRSNRGRSLAVARASGTCSRRGCEARTTGHYERASRRARRARARGARSERARPR